MKKKKPESEEFSEDDGMMGEGFFSKETSPKLVAGDKKYFPREVEMVDGKVVEKKEKKMTFIFTVG